MKGGVDFRYPALGGTLGLILEGELMSAKWSNDSGFSAKSKTSFGRKTTLNYTYHFSRRFGAILDLARQTNRYDFNTFQVDRINRYGGVKLLLNF